MGIFDDLDEEELEKRIYRLLCKHFGRYPVIELEIATEEIMELLEEGDEYDEFDEESE